MKISELYTFQNSSEGVNLAIKFPDGTSTGQSIRVRGTDSLEFQKAARDRRKNHISIMALPEDEQEAALAAGGRLLTASLVAGWTFEGKATVEAVEELFKNAPDVMQQVDEFCIKRVNFFKLPLKN